MTVAMFRAMFLSLLNDRGALAMAFILPVVFFLLLAEIFSGAAGAEMQLNVAIADEIRQRSVTAPAGAMEASGVVVPLDDEPLSAADVMARVRKGSADVGLVLRADARALDDVGGFGAPPILIVSDPSRAVAAPMLSGQVQKAYFEALPEVALGSVVQMIGDQYVEFDAAQTEDIEAGLEEMRDAAIAGESGGWSFGEMLEQLDVAGQSAATNHVAYYAGAVAFLFLLFASMQGAISLAEEQESGILDRIMAGPGGIAVLVNGKFLFLVAQGFVQMLLIFFVAWQVYGVDLPGPLRSMARSHTDRLRGGGGFVPVACRSLSHPSAGPESVPDTRTDTFGRRWQHGAPVFYAAVAAGSGLADSQYLGAGGLLRDFLAR